MVGLPSFTDIGLALTELAMKGPLGAVVQANEQGRAAAEAVAAANGDQSPEAIAARNRIQDLTDNHFDGEFHNPRVPEHLFGNFRSQDLDELYRKAQTIDVSAMDTLARMWEARAGKLETGLAEFGPKILTAIAESWSGASASAAATGITDYVAKAQNLVSGTKIVADKVAVVKSAVEVTKQNVQPAPDTGWAGTVASWIPGPTWKMNSDRQILAEYATHSVLEKVYNPGIREGDTGQPRIPLAYNPIHETGSPGPGPGPVVPGGTHTEPPAATTDTDSAQPAPSPETAGPENGENQPTSPQSAPDPGAAPTTPAGLGSSTPATTAAGTTVPPVPGSPSTTPGSPSGVPGTPGAPIGTAPGTPLPGQTVPGPGPGAGRPGSAPVAATAAGAPRGTSGMAPGMMPPGARGRGEDDNEKQKSAIAEALVTQERGNELVGLDPEHRPRTVPPVLGDEN